MFAELLSVSGGVCVYYRLSLSLHSRDAHLSEADLRHEQLAALQCWTESIGERQASTHMMPRVVPLYSPPGFGIASAPTAVGAPIPATTKPQVCTPQNSRPPSQERAQVSQSGTVKRERALCTCLRQC